MKKEVFGIKDGVLIRYYENEKDDGNNDGMKKIGDLSKLLYKEGGLLVPKGVSKIGGLSNPFYNCRSLASVVIPKGVTEISGEAFKGCKNLTSVTGDRLCRTCARHSEGCADVMPASIPGSVKYVGYEAFAGCTSLTDVSIPAGMTEICTGTFAGCTSLKEIRYGGTRAQWAAVQRGASWCDISIESIICTDGKSMDVGSNCDKDGMYFRLGA
ncbi:MAG: leucine-rich repeat domain-containing protein [Treponema sp.]|nr:leucine-rich repeat domain-containing protein [Treponema sp.]